VAVGRIVPAAMFTTTGCCATVEIVNPGRFAAKIVIFESRRPDNC
jgi:hypothetical protein